MKLFVRRYDELSPDELYAMVRLRVAVFVVEQHCPYQELDGRDQAAIHVWLQDKEGIAAYLRVMDRGVESGPVSIGRVIAARRRQGLGSRVMREGIRAARAHSHADSIYLEAQVYAKPFYEQLGFRQVSGEFPEDGIPHIQMLLDPIEQEESQ